MNRKIFVLLFVSLIVSSSAYPWGDKGHRLIMRKAMEILPEELSFLQAWKDYLAARVTDPDDRKKLDKTEDPKHYIDMDFYKEFLRGEMVYHKDSLIKIYTEEKVTEIGILPWASLESFENLTAAFAEKNRDRILIIIADLAHYVADGHQPLHTVLNYDGQLTGQKGLHGRYEIEMIDRYLEKLEQSVIPGFSQPIYKPLEYIFGYLKDANFKNDIILASDNVASANSEINSGEYYNILWYRTENLTVEQMSKAAEAIASLILTAWNNAGKPPGNEIN